MSGKRKRDLLETFDPNKSDSEDENFDPTEARPRKTSRKARSSKRGKPSRKKSSRRYRGSDIDDDDDELSDSQEDSFDDEESEESEDEDAPKNAAGRRARKVTTQQHNYKESSEDEEVVAEDSPDDAEGDDAAEEQESPPQRETRARRLVKLKVPTPAKPLATRRMTRATTEDAEELVELSNSGNHAIPTRASRSKSPEALRRARSSRSTKTVVKPEATIEEATQENSSKEIPDADEPDELSQEYAEQEAKKEAEALEPVSGDIPIGDDQEADAAVEPAAEDEDEDDDVPITRRTRGSRANIEEEPVEPEDAEGEAVDTEQTGQPRRLTRRSVLKKKSAAEPSSDFDPGEESDDDAALSGKGEHEDNEPDSPTPRGRAGRRARPSRGGGGADSAEEEPDFDMDELNEEARELRAGSRPRRRRQREESPIIFEEKNRRSRNKVNYYMPPLTAAIVEEEEDPAPTPGRSRRGRGAAATNWERNLNTTFGPFGGGGGGGSLLTGPWGTGATGGVDSDSSDDEMVHRSNVAGNIGMTPTSAAPAGGLLPGGQGLAAETPNVGKIKDRKALADADPLGVDMNVDFSKVGGLQGHIDQLKEMVQLPLLYPELFAKFHVTPPRGVLFHGPPGTGKTLLARALANSVGSGGKKISFYMRKGADALSKWVGEAEKQLRLLFEEARKTQPSIIFFDEIDGLAPVRSSKQEQIHASIVSTLLALMDGMDGRGQVIVIGATNRPDNIDPALRRPGRFDREFYFPLPDIDGRRSIINIHTEHWGLADDFKHALAQQTKGYGGADLRALSTEAALNAIQRTYPQIYSSKEKLIVNPDKISVHASDFMMAIKKLIPSSERSATSGAQPLPKSIHDLLSDQFEAAKQALDEVLPRKKKMTALEEAMYEQFNDADHGFGREVLHQEFERSRVFRPRFIIHGAHGMGQGYLASAILHYLEGVHVQNFDLPSLLNDGRAMEQVIVGLFTEVRRHKPSVIYIPNIDAWYASLKGTLAMITFQTMLRSIPPTDPVLVFATAECEQNDLPAELFRDFFGFSRKNRMEIPRPTAVNRRKYFAAALGFIKKKPADFPDPENRKKRVLEVLPVAPAPQPKPPTKAEMKALKKKDHQLLNTLKIQLQPIMDQINRKYKKFRQPVIPQTQIDYLFAESDPNFVSPDVTEGLHRPFAIVKDKHGNDVLMDTATEKTYYNLETTTIEERLSNGFYARPKDFLFDIRSLSKDAKNIGDKERTLKANELLSNVEVDVASIEQSTSAIDWEGLYTRQVLRAKEQAEKERKRQAMQLLVDRVQSDLGGNGNDSDSQGPVTLGESVPGSRTTARFQVRSPLVNPPVSAEQDPQPVSNGTSHAADADVQMSGVDDDTQLESETSGMPPPKAAGTGMTQISQRSAVTSLPPGVSPSAVINDASTTKTSDPSTHRSSNWSTQLTNGNHDEHNQSGLGDHDDDIPDTAPMPSQVTSSGEDVWVHSQAQALRSNIAAGESHATTSGSPPSPQSYAQRTPSSTKSHGIGVMDILNTQSDDVRHSNSSSQPLGLDPAIDAFLEFMTDKTSGCTIEQLEQINRELMDEIWRSRNEWNRLTVLNHVKSVFNLTIDDIERMQGMGPLSQTRPSMVS